MAKIQRYGVHHIFFTLSNQRGPLYSRTVCPHCQDTRRLRSSSLFARSTPSTTARDRMLRHDKQDSATRPSRLTPPPIYSTRHSRPPASRCTRPPVEIGQRALACTSLAASCRVLPRDLPPGIFQRCFICLESFHSCRDSASQGWNVSLAWLLGRAKRPSGTCPRLYCSGQPNRPRFSTRKNQARSTGRHYCRQDLH